MKFTESDLHALQVAKSLLENPGLAARMSNLVGMPIERGLELLPDNWSNNIGEITQTALIKASDAAIFTMKDLPGEEPSNFWHKFGAAAAGGAGGFFGIAGTAIELPITTTIMMRSIADVARSEGESISTISTKMACLEVFAMGGRSKADEGAESGYFAVRAALARSVTEATEFIARKGVTKYASPALVKFISRVAERFGVQVTQKAAAQAIPALGAAGGAIINTLFMDHFQDMANGHFTVRRLERIYGSDMVIEVYASLPARDEQFDQ